LVDQSDTRENYDVSGTLQSIVARNGQYDTDGKISQIVSAGTKTYGYDNAFRITGITDTSPGAAN
jgi:hypothetical protein